MREYQSSEIKDLADALVKAQAEMKHAEKTSVNPYFKAKYADLSAVIDAAKPALVKNGLSVTQFSDFDEQGVFLITQIMHLSGQWIRSYYPINPTKNDPQGLGSAFTYARRYAYSAITGITAEDDDGNAASEPAKHAVENIFDAKPISTDLDQGFEYPTWNWMMSVEANVPKTKKDGTPGKPLYKQGGISKGQLEFWHGAIKDKGSSTLEVQQKYCVPNNLPVDFTQLTWQQFDKLKELTGVQ